MNQWVATKKWLLFMNLGPVVFVSNREVKRLATMFYSRSTNQTGWELRVENLGCGKGFTLSRFCPLSATHDILIVFDPSHLNHLPLPIETKCHR